MNSSTTASAVKRSGVRSTVMFSLFNFSAVLLPIAQTLCEISSARPCPSASSRRRKYSTPFALVKTNQSYQLKWIKAQSSCAQSRRLSDFNRRAEDDFGANSFQSACHLAALFDGSRDDDAASGQRECALRLFQLWQRWL